VEKRKFLTLPGPELRPSPPPDIPTALSWLHLIQVAVVKLSDEKDGRRSQIRLLTIFKIICCGNSGWPRKEVTLIARYLSEITVLEH
jgi:hypothetical protein